MTGTGGSSSSAEYHSVFNEQSETMRGVARPFHCPYCKEKMKPECHHIWYNYEGKISYGILPTKLKRTFKSLGDDSKILKYIFNQSALAKTDKYAKVNFLKNVCLNTDVSTDSNTKDIDSEIQNSLRYYLNPDKISKLKHSAENIKLLEFGLRAHGIFSENDVSDTINLGLSGKFFMEKDVVDPCSFLTVRTIEETSTIVYIDETYLDGCETKDISFMKLKWALLTARAYSDMLQFARQTLTNGKGGFFDDMEITHTDMCLHGERRIECRQLVLLFQECEDICKNKSFNKELRRGQMLDILKEKLPKLTTFNPTTEKGKVLPINIDKKQSNELVKPEVIKRVINVLYADITDQKLVERKEKFISLFKIWEDFKSLLHKRTDFLDEEAYRLLDISDSFCFQWLQLFGSQRFTNYICILSTGNNDF